MMALQVVVVEDNLLVRSGFTAVLSEIGLDVIETFEDASTFEASIPSIVERADLAVLDVRLPPSHTTEGIDLAAALRRQRGGFPVALVSQHVETSHLAGLLESSTGGVGYLLKDRILDLATIGSTLAAVANGEVRLDPTVVSALMGRHHVNDPVQRLTPREREVLALMAQGLSNTGIAKALTVNTRTVESHVAALFERLGLAVEGDTNRRVRAVVTYLRDGR